MTPYQCGRQDGDRGTSVARARILDRFDSSQNWVSFGRPRPMIELFFATSVNVYKVLIALEELKLPYSLSLIDISKGEQHQPANIAGSIARKLPVIRDDEPADDGPPQVVFESGAILLYLAEKTGRLLPEEHRARLDVIQWLFWQTSGLGPIGGQAWHFHAFAPRLAPGLDNTYSRDRYFK